VLVLRKQQLQNAVFLYMLRALYTITWHKKMSSVFFFKFMGPSMDSLAKTYQLAASSHGYLKCWKQIKNLQNRILKMRQTRNEDEVVTSIVNFILDLSLTLVWDPVNSFVFIECNTSRVGPHCNTKPTVNPLLGELIFLLQ